MKRTRFNWSVFSVSSMAFGLLFIPAFGAAFALDEGTLQPDDTFGYVFAKVFDILRFPTHTLLWSFISMGGNFIFFSGLVINWMFYGLLIERVVSVFKNRRGCAMNKIGNV